MSGARDLVAAIRDDRVHGAGWLAQEALRGLALAAEESQATEASALLAEIRALARELAAARPSMAPIANYVARLIYELSSSAPGDVAALQALIVRRAEELVAESDGATETVAEVAAEALASCPLVMTVSYSSTVVKALSQRRPRGVRPAVLAVESRSPGGPSYGEAVADLLRLRGLRADVVPDDGVVEAMARAAAVLVGADSILPDGALINGQPTLLVVEAAAARRVPVLVAAETVKVNAGPLLGHAVEVEEGFDLIPARFITAYATERGRLAPNQVRPLADQWALYLRAL